ncbi:permease [Bacillus suaedae]|uniref:Permease n=1 Tax=Halalkalibacter suaedae TaxID=2822140 RepID=A0A940WW00_9BACI|nr:permease [Bacillus suaedae]MBP3951602.1 permease [Bacillus suaedae]
MFAGHFGLAAAVKAKEPQVPLWALMVSTQLLDLIFVPLLIADIERLELLGPGIGEVIIHADYSHSLVSALIISLIAFFLGAWRWGKRSGFVIGGVVFSHWLLDFLVHRADMAIVPGNLGNFPLLGLGMWKWPIISMTVEGILVIIGSILYFRYVLTRQRETSEVSLSRALFTGTIMATLLVLSLVTDLLGIG